MSFPVRQDIRCHFLTKRTQSATKLALHFDAQSLQLAHLYLLWAKPLSGHRQNTPNTTIGTSLGHHWETTTGHRNQERKQDTIETPPRGHQNTTTPPRHHRHRQSTAKNTTGTPPTHRQNIAKNTPGHYQDTTKTAPKTLPKYNNWGTTGIPLGDARRLSRE